MMKTYLLPLFILLGLTFCGPTEKPRKENYPNNTISLAINTSRYTIKNVDQDPENTADIVYDHGSASGKCYYAPGFENECKDRNFNRRKLSQEGVEAATAILNGRPALAYQMDMADFEAEQESEAEK